MNQFHCRVDVCVSLVRPTAAAGGHRFRFGAEVRFYSPFFGAVLYLGTGYRIFVEESSDHTGSHSDFFHLFFLSFRPLRCIAAVSTVKLLPGMLVDMIGE